MAVTKATTKVLLIYLICFVFKTNIRAQLSGTYNVPTNYATLSAAISALNIQGVSGPVFIEISAGYTETVPVGGYSLTATGTALNPITFRKTGVGANPLITAYAGGTATPASANQDGVWRLIGSDYITIDGIDILDPNLTNPATMEYGYGFFKASTSNGCQNNVIQNCVINLKTINNATGTAPAVDGSRGINVVNSLFNTQTTAMVPVSFAGTNSNNDFYGNTIRNCNVGIALIGYVAPSPFTLADIGNDIGGSSVAQGNTIVNFGGAVAATNPAAGVRTLAQYDLNVSFNNLKNNDGTGANHVATLRGIYINTATSANIVATNNTLTLNGAGLTAQVAAIENVAGATAANNTVSINNNLILNCTYTTNTTGSFFGIFNNGASASYLNINNNRFSGVSSMATTGSNYLIYNTGGIASGISMNNNFIENCSNIASTSGVYYNIFNNAISPAILTINSNTINNNTSSASTGATYLIYNSSATSNSITLNNNAISSCTNVISSTGAFFGIFNNGASNAVLEMKANTFFNHRVNAFSGATHLIYNTAAIANGITLRDNVISGTTNSITSTGSYYAIYNNAASSSNLEISNNTFTANSYAATSGSVHLVFNRGALTNTFVNASINNNLIANCSFSATANSPFLGLYNSGVTCSNLSLSGNTITGNSWLGATSAKFLVLNNGVVSNTLNLNNNLISASGSTNNTTGTFNGIYNTGTCTLAVNMCGNTFSNISNSSTTGGTFLLFNSGAVPGGIITITNNAVSGFTNTATAAGDFYGISNSGTTFSTLEITDNTYSANIINSATGVSSFMSNAGAVSTTINNINLSNNLIANCTSSVNSTGSFFGIYNNAASCVNLQMSNNTYTNNISFAANGANHLIYNRGAITNTFASVNINGNLISNCTHSASAGAGFYSIWNNGVTSTLTGITNNTITGSLWASASALRYLISNWGVAVSSANISNNLVSNCSHTNNTTGSLFHLYNNNNTAVSSGTLLVSNNTFTNINTTATTGETHFITNGGITTNTFSNIQITNNLVTNITSSVNGGGSFFGIYNNTASTNSLNISQNTFTNSALTSSNGSTHFIYNRGVAGNLLATVTISNNLLTGLTHSNNSTGILYGVINVGAATTTCSLLSIKSNTFMNSVSSGTSGQINILNNTCPVTSSIEITNNVFSNITNSITTTGGFFAINNGGNSAGGDLSISNNIFTNLISTASSASRYLIYNSGGITNSVSIQGNLISNCSHSISGAGSYFGINNNASSSGLSANISNNTFTNNFSSSVNGNINLLLNSGLITNTITNVLFSNNVVDSYTSISTGGNFYGLFNSGYTSSNLSITTNTFNNILLSSSATAQQLIFNNGRITNTLSINNNLISGYTNTINTTGIFYGIINNANFANGNFPLSFNVTNNRFLNNSLNSTSGGVFFINNSGVLTNTMNVLNISGNLLSNSNNTITGNTSFYAINNTAISSGSLSINSNTFTNIVNTGTSITRYMIFNGGAVVNSADFSNNLISNFTGTTNTIGAYFGINNGGNILGNLSITNNSFFNHTLSATSASAFVIYNTGVINNSITIANNLISGFTNSASSSGGFLGLYNNSASSSALAITSNSLTNISLTTLTGATHFIYNRGLATSTISTITFSDNVISIGNFSATSGPFYGIFNSATSFSNLNISANSFGGIASTTSTSPRYFIFNSGAGSGGISINTNTVSNYNATLNTTGVFYDVLNTGASAGNLEISGNAFVAQTLPSTTGSAYLINNTGAITNSIIINNNFTSGVTHSSTTGTLYCLFNNSPICSNLSISNNVLNTISTSNTVSTKYLIYNTGAASNDIHINSNSISGFSALFNTTGTFAGVYNTGTLTGNFDASNNSFNNLAITTTTANCYVIYNTGTSTTNINSVNINNNSVAGLTSTLNSGAFYGLFNNGVPSGSLSMSGNTFSNCVSSTTNSPRYLVYNTGSVTSTMNFTNNLVANYTSSLNSAAVFYGVHNSALCNGSLNMSNNTFTNNFLESTTGINFLIYNSANVSNTINMDNNTIAGTTNSTTSSGVFYGIYNTGNALSSLSMNGNSFNNNSSSATTANTHLLYNTGIITNSISMSNNNLGYSFTNNSVDYSGTLYSVYNTGGTNTTTLTINGNNFSNYLFNGLPGLGNLYFIYNTNNNSRYDVSNNTWTNLFLNHNANEYLIYNPTSTSLEHNVLNNSVTGYTRTANDGVIYAYYANGFSPSTCTQLISGNNFSNITNSTLATGSFYGIYSTDGTPFSYPRKIVSNNSISNVNYNGLGFFYGYYLDYLGDVSALGSSVFSNTLSSISWSGPLYGFYLGANTSAGYKTTIYSNTIYNLNSFGSTSDIYGAYLTGGGAGIDFYRNKISDLTTNGTSATVDGLRILSTVNTGLSNNVIGNIYAPVSSLANAVNGINISGAALAEIYYNSVHLNATSTGTAFGSNALQVASTVSLSLRNNILINNSISTGTGVTASYRRSTTSLSNYLITSNNNIFYAGIPASNRLIFCDGTNSLQTLPAYQALVSPRDNLSFWENTNFISTVGTNANFLHVDAALPSLTESGAININGITDDFDSQVRQGNIGYVGAGIAPDIGADEYNQNLTPCSAVNAGSVSVHSSNVKCQGETAYLFSTGFTLAGGITHQWRVSSTQGGPYSNVTGGAGTNSVAYTTQGLNTGTYYYVLSTTCTLSSQTAVSNEVTVTVNAVPSATASLASQTLCSGQNLSLSGTTDIGTNYNWAGPNNFTSTLQNPTIANAATNASGIYTLLVSDANCTSSPVFVSTTVNPTPPAFSLTPQTSSICIGSSQTITASIPISNPTLNFGNQTNQNTASTYPAPYSVYYGGQKMQLLILAGELAAAGFTTGTPLQSIQFPVVSLGSNWSNTLQHCNNFMVGVKATSITALTAFETGVSNVVSPSNFTPAVGYNNTHSFSSPFIWDGNSNIIIETVFSNSLIGTVGNSVIQYNSPTGFQSTLVYRADNQNISAIAAATNSNVNVGFVRPDFRLNGIQVGTYSWSPSGGLSTTTGTSSVASPTSTSIYSVELSNGVCASTSTVAIHVILVPTISIASSAQTVCLGNTATLTASGATTYTWSTNSNNSNIVVAPFVSTTYTVNGSNPFCPNSSSNILIISAPALVINTLALPPVICNGQSSTLIASGASTYTWIGGFNTNSLIVSPSVTTNYLVSGSNGPGCRASRAINLKVNQLPVISITPSLTTICKGESVTFEASGVFSFTWSPGNSNSPIYAVSPTVSTTYTVVGVDLNNCSNSATADIIVDPCVGLTANSDLMRRVSLFPNPTSGIFTIQFEFEGGKKLFVLNSVGALVYTKSTTNTSEEIDLSQLAKGIYFVKVLGEGFSGNYKLIID